MDGRERGVYRAAMHDPGPLPPYAPQRLTVAGHELTIFVQTQPLFDAMHADIDGARKRIWLETYIFADDAGATRIAAFLKEKARQGLDVRVLYDAFGSALTPAAFWSDLASAGVHLHAYHSLLEFLQRFKPLSFFNRRDHCKLLVIDDALGYFGGMNIIDNVENVGRRPAAPPPPGSGWRDVHIRLEGPQAGELAESFDRRWARAHGSHIRRQRSVSPRARLAEILSGPPQQEQIAFFDSVPHGRLSMAGRVYRHLLRHARLQIIIAMAYFIPTGGVLRALLAARRRRVAVRVIVPGKSDLPIVQHATAWLYHRLIRRGFRIYERRHRMLHSKLMVVDDLYTVVGSANLDPRSLHTNLEFLAVIRSQALARVMARICRFEIGHSQRITLAQCRRTSAWRRLLNRLAWSLRWWL